MKARPRGLRINIVFFNQQKNHFSCQLLNFEFFVIKNLNLDLGPDPGSGFGFTKAWIQIRIPELCISYVVLDRLLVIVSKSRAGSSKSFSQVPYVDFMLAVDGIRSFAR
jgi:hypothetical protein